MRCRALLLPPSTSRLMYPRYWRYRAVRAIPWPGGGFELSRQLRLGTYLCIVPRLRALPSFRSLPSDVNHPPPCRHRSVAVAGMCRRVTTNLVTASDSVPASRSICPPTFYVFTASHAGACAKTCYPNLTAY